MIQLIFYFMDGELQKANAWSRIFIGATIKVHRLKGAMITGAHLPQVRVQGM